MLCIKAHWLQNSQLKMLGDSITPAYLNFVFINKNYSRCFKVATPFSFAIAEVFNLLDDTNNI